MKFQKLFFLTLLLCSTFFVFGQSQTIEKDSIPSTKETLIKPKAFILPAILVTYGFIATYEDELQLLNQSTRDEIREDNPLFNSRIDNFTQFVPGITVFILDGIGVKSEHNWKDQAMIYTTSLLVSTAFVLPIKNLTKIERPDGSARNSFPSGHTTFAFASAEFLYQEFKNTSVWIGIAGYAVATTTGIFRMYNNRHWFSDVIAGAGFGIASTKIAYLLYDKVYKKNGWNFSLSPVYQDKTFGVAFSKTF